MLIQNAHYRKRRESRRSNPSTIAAAEMREYAKCARDRAVALRAEAMQARRQARKLRTRLHRNVQEQNGPGR
jgi:hypothetical protein